MFSVVRVCHSVCPGVVPIITHDVLDLTASRRPPPDSRDPAPSPHQTWNPRSCPLLLTSGGQHWPNVQTCSLEDTPPPGVTSSDAPIGMLLCYIFLEIFDAIVEPTEFGQVQV